MNEIKERDFINSLKNNQLSPYQIYNFDLDYSLIYSAEYYLKHVEDSIKKEQKLNILFFDIEVFTNNSGEFPIPSLAKYPIVSNTIYSTFEKCYHAYFMLMGENINLFPSNNISELEESFTKYLNENGYMDDDETIKINLCNSENEVIIDSWNKIHELDPVILSGFSADNFDLPYIYNRLMGLCNNKEQVHNILSKFGNTKIRNYGKNQIVSILEYPLADIRHLYVTRAEGGLNYGKTQASYSLDWISNDELNLKKLEYKRSGMSIDDFYLKEPSNYLLYNIIDVILTNKLNQKLQHIELHNMLRRIMKVPFSTSLRGSKALFDGFVFHELKSQNKNIRFGIINERQMEISEEELKVLPRPKIQLVKKETIKEITSNQFTKCIFRFPGA